MIRHAAAALVLTAAFAAPGATQQSAAEQRQQEKLAEALAGLTPGAPVHCLSRRQVTSVRTFGDTFLYVEGRNRVWRNETSGGCSGRDDILVSRSSSAQYCSGDIIQTRDRTGGMPTGSCALGEFVPYSK